MKVRDLLGFGTDDCELDSTNSLSAIGHHAEIRDRFRSAARHTPLIVGFVLENPEFESHLLNLRRCHLLAFIIEWPHHGSTATGVYEVVLHVIHD